MDLQQIQEDLKSQGMDGWLIYDFQKINPFFYKILNLSEGLFATRRLLYMIPKEGEPIKLVHAVESELLDTLPGKKLIFSSREEWRALLQKWVPKARFAMEFSPEGDNPYVSKVDAGTIDFIRGLGVEVVSSQDLLQSAISILTPQEVESHIKASEDLVQVFHGAWNFIRELLTGEVLLTEKIVQNWMLEEFERRNLMTDHPPIVAVNSHTAEPHHVPNDTPIKETDFLLLDAWAKKIGEKTIYADYTCVAVIGREPYVKEKEIFDIVKQARDATIDLVQTRFKEGRKVFGFEADMAAREVITKAGYGPYFVHRTGHNIGYDDHGSGCHLDSLETKDTRQLLPRTLFSIEPGIYLPEEFGVRLEVNGYMDPQKGIQVTGLLQNEIPVI